MIYVIARNSDQFHDWLHFMNIPRQDAIYITSGRTRGKYITEDDDLFFVGDWYDRPDIEEIREAVLLCFIGKGPRMIGNGGWVLSENA